MKIVVHLKTDFEVEESFRGFIKFWTDPITGILSLSIFKDYRILERIYNSANWTPDYHKEVFLTADLKWLYNRVVFGLVNHPSISYNQITETIFIRKMRRWISIVTVFKEIPTLKLNDM